jgi:hypothetical protein
VLPKPNRRTVALVRDYGILVVPVDLSKAEAELFIGELRTSGINRTTH